MVSGTFSPLPCVEKVAFEPTCLSPDFLILFALYSKQDDGKIVAGLE